MARTLRRLRPLMIVVAVWLLFVWYLFGDDLRQGASSSSRLSNDPKIATLSHITRWEKHPDRYPVTSYQPLPTGSAAAAIPAIQKTPAPAEDVEARRVRLARLAAVQESFRHSWEGYKAHAWLHDEVAPLTGHPKNPFGGWAATLVDALDALWIMGLREEFEAAVEAVSSIDFATTQTASINVFETTIRYLGGFLAAYELSDMKYPSLLRKAVEVAELLMCAFDTPNRMPISRWDWRSYTAGHDQWASRTMLVSELGSLSLEFTKLSQLTGEVKYYDAVQRVSDEFEKGQDTTKLPGMWPIVVDGLGPFFSSDNSFTLGGMSDSLYEYFPKQYLILGGILEQPRKLYEGFIDVAKKHLFRRAMNENNIPIIIPGDARITVMDGEPTVIMTPRGQHLTCFTGGMVGLASRIFDRPDDMDVAIQLTDACVWTYNATASGIGPEIFSFVACGKIEEEQAGPACAYSEQKWRTAIRDFWRPSSEMDPSDPQISNIINSRRLPPGMLDVTDKKYILRPEAIESVFVMWRITGDPAWMDKAWEMFRHIETHTRGEIAAASLDDVTKAAPVQVDSMESFWLAETLKYFYLMFSEWDVVDLDKWVLNTEAHPLRRPDA